LTGDDNTFDSAAFLANAGLGRTIVELKPKQTFFCQSDIADSVFYLQKGRAKVTVVSQKGKEATITLLSAHDFVGEESLAMIDGRHMATATAVNTCTALRITKSEMIRAPWRGNRGISVRIEKFAVAGEGEFVRILFRAMLLRN